MRKNKKMNQIKKMLLSLSVILLMATLFTACKKPEENNPNNKGEEQEANFITFTFDGIIGTAKIDKTNRTVLAKANETVDLKTLVVTFTLSENATAKVDYETQESGKTANNFTKTIIYRITSMDGKTTNIWSVAVTGGIPFWSNDVDVYVVGSKKVDNTTYPVLWKNGVAQYLPIGRDCGAASSVFVSGNDVYVVGSDWSRNGPILVTAQTALLWKNGVRQPLPSGTTFAEALSVFVSGNDVYVVGDASGGSETGAKLWINGVAQPNLSGGASMKASSVFVSNGDVYVAGSMLWKNGTAQDFDAYLTSVFVSENDVYVAGRQSTYNSWIAKLWKNGVSQNLVGGTLAESVFVSGKDVYVVGSGSGSGKLWKNGVGKNIEGSASSVFVLGEDVYIALISGELWKNGVTETLDGTLKSVFVVKKNN